MQEAMNQGQRVKPAPQSGPRDVWAAGLFAVNVLAIVAIAGMWGPGALKGDGSAGSANATATNATATEDSLSTAELKVVMGCTLGSVVVGGILSILAIQLLLRAGGKMITCAIFTNIVFLLIFGTVSLAANFILALILYIIAAINICYYYCVRNRIPFAAANLNVACKAVKTHQSVLCVSYSMMVISFVWVVLWSIAFLGILHHKQEQKYEELQAQAAQGIEECNSIYEVECGASTTNNAQCHTGYTCTGRTRKQGNRRVTNYECTCDNAVSVSSFEYYFLPGVGACK